MEPKEFCWGEYTPEELEEYRDRYLKSPLRAIRMKCIDCSGYSANEVKLCTIPHCPLYEFRFGKKPERLRPQLTKEQRQAMAERLKRARSKVKT